VQSLVPQAVRVVLQLLVWVNFVPEQTVLVAGDQEETAQGGALTVKGTEKTGFGLPLKEYPGIHCLKSAK
jgi:hypothetical protein